MTDKLAAIVPKIAPLLRMLGSCTDGEAVNVINALRLKLVECSRVMTITIRDEGGER
jgi:hypothetical protein